MSFQTNLNALFASPNPIHQEIAQKIINQFVDGKSVLDLSSQYGICQSNVSMILLLLIIISFAAGSFNYFPADPFDGGRMAKIMLAPYFGFLGLTTS